MTEPGRRRIWFVGVCPVVVAVAVMGGSADATAAVPSVTYVVPAGEAHHESRPTLTGAGKYSSLSASYDRAAANNQPNRAVLKGEAYLGDGGATVSYTIKKLAAAPLPLALWINYSDVAKHAAGARDVDISIPQLHWTKHWFNQPQDTKGWKAVKVGTITTAGNITVRFRKTATTSAAFTLNAFALTNAPGTPPFAPKPALPVATTVAPKGTGTYDGAWGGSFSGTLGGQPAAGGVTASVTNNLIKVTRPITGTGRVSPQGAVSVTGALGTLGVTCTYNGVLVVPPSGSAVAPSVRAGTWTCSGVLAGAGTWDATRR